MNAVSVADQVQAVLRDSDVPLTATEIGARIPMIVALPCSGDYCCAEPGSGRGLELMWAQHGADRDIVACSSTGSESVRSVLKTMSNVAREKVGRRVYWTWVGEVVDMADFEAALLA